jgi:hypothetical protein
LVNTAVMMVDFNKLKRLTNLNLDRETLIACGV